jgi:hypothetical protein
MYVSQDKMPHIVHMDISKSGSRGCLQSASRRCVHQYWQIQGQIQGNYLAVMKVAHKKTKRDANNKFQLIAHQHKPNK